MRNVSVSFVLFSALIGCNGPPPVVEKQQARLSAPSSNSFVEFESGQVRPLAISDDGEYLYAVNTPDNRLEIFAILDRPRNGTDLQSVGSVVVGLEPVAVAVHGHTAWVVNHLSDSVSIVDLSGGPLFARVVRTLLVGDEPRDIVFAGQGRNRAFVTAAHRGQNTGRDPQLTTPGVGRADVWVFDANNLGDSLGGDALTVLSLFTDTPRALAVTPDGSRVYAAGFETGNQTTTINQAIVNAPGGPGGPGPSTNHQGIAAPPVGLIVKFDGQHWVDERGTPWDGAVKFSLPDKDVFAIDANANPPRSTSSYAHVGTILLNMVVNPASGKLYVSNLDEKNEVRFEGAGTFVGHRGVQGHLAESDITVIDPSTQSVVSRHLNKHIDYSQCCAEIPNDENARSLAFPTGMAVTRDGRTLYVASLGSSKVGIYRTADLEAGTFTPSTSNQVLLTGGGATGLALNSSNGRLYVMTRFDNSISTVDPSTKNEVGHIAMYNPEPASVVQGRRFLYDASLTSSHGDSACASCHIFGDFDSLAWDLGNPDGDAANDNNPFDDDPNFATFIFGQPTAFHPMKGPMTTQSLRGMSNHGPMHWRGDRTGSFDEPNAQPDSGAFDERDGFNRFNPAFVSLVGRAETLPQASMDAFTSFILQVAYPPNPLRNLDNSDTPDQAAARAFYFNADSTVTAPATKCGDCHALDPSVNAQYGVQFPGLFGTDGKSSFVFEPQLFKNPHLRNQYQKVGMFGNPPLPGIVLPGNNSFLGDQVRGFGFFHDGSIDTDFRFVSSTLFPGFGGAPDGDPTRRQMESLMLAFDSNFPPIVGQQTTLNAADGTAVRPRITLLEASAALGQCDLVVKARLLREVGFLFTTNGYRSDRSGAPLVSSSNLQRLALLTPLTYTCVPAGSGQRIGLDRNNDGILDGDQQ